MKWMGHYVAVHKLPEKLAAPLLLMLGVFYLIFNVLSGEHGVYALLREERRLEIMKSELTGLTEERKKMEHKVRLMSSASIDRDMLDEQARKVLDDAAGDEVVIPARK